MQQAVAVNTRTTFVVGRLGQMSVEHQLFTAAGIAAANVTS